MSDDINLCCCEYLDNNNEQNHILACCCNCVDLDEAVDNLIKGRGFPQNNRTKLMATLQDRLRIPWRGGAKRISFDAALPIFILPIMFLLASISLWWTVFTFTAVIVILLCVFNFFIRHIPKTKFFLVWTITSILILYVVFEFIVIPLLEILFEENITLSILIGAFLFCLYLTKLRGYQLNKLNDNEPETGAVGVGYDRLYNCSICQITVPDKDHHCIWFDCCIGRHNQCLFILTLVFAIAALVYSSNLTLTSVCHPFVFYKTILLPDDCSEVYEQFDLSLSFVTAIYSLGIAVILFILLLQQFFLVSIGLTGKEWHNLPFSAKLCCGLLTNRPHSRGFFGNWSRIMCWTRNHYNYLNQRH